MVLRALIVIAVLAVLPGCAAHRATGHVPLEMTAASAPWPVALQPEPPSALHLRSANSTEAGKVIGVALVATSLVILILVNRSNAP